MTNPKISTSQTVRKQDFAYHFRLHTMAKLRRMITAEARCIAAGVETWAGAYDACWAYCVRSGALHLPPATLEDLEYLVSIRLLAEIDKAEQEGWNRWPHMGV